MGGDGESRGQQVRWVAGILGVGVACVVLLLVSSDTDNGGESTPKADRPAPGIEPRDECGPAAGPAEIVGPRAVLHHTGPPIGQIVNGWNVRTDEIEVAVEAGAVDRDGTFGALRISYFRTCNPSNSPASVLVEVGETGPVRITDAPEGQNVPSSAVREAKLRFVGANGGVGTLDLDGVSVTCHSPPSECRAIPGIDCPDPRSRAGVAAWDMDCGAVRDFLVSAPEPCFDLPVCRRGGFTCKWGEGGAGTVPITCQRSTQRIAFIHSIG